jgi:hypothetical protein
MVALMTLLLTPKGEHEKALILARSECEQKEEGFGGLSVPLMKLVSRTATAVLGGFPYPLQSSLAELLTSGAMPA